MKYLLISVLLMTEIANGQTQIHPTITNNSRNSSVKIISKIGNISGTGFFISNDIIATCFHLIAQYSVDSAKNINFNIYPDLQAIIEDGDTVSLKCVSIPNNSSPEPFLQDFALLKTSKIVTKKTIAPLSKSLNYSIGESIVFSGYPLGTPTLVSHFGTISGITKDKSIICIQASTNKGNSGGALLDEKGNVIGIISMREGGISLGLQNYLIQITETEKMGSVKLMGIDPLQATKETIQVLDTYISTGIGYARNIKFLNDYILKHKIKI